MVGFLKKLFGGGSAAPVDVAAKAPDDVHKDIEIRANPMSEAGGQWRIAGTLTKIEGDEKIVRKFVRADMVQSQDEAISASIAKAKMIIDQNGAYIWKGNPNQPV